jgi:hypothetical protein
MPNFACDWKSGFVMDPSKKQRVGYLVWFQGLGMDSEGFFKQDIEVFSPYEATGAAYTEVGSLWVKDSGKMTATGVIENISWEGGVGDPICVSAYISTENALTLKAKMQGTLATTKVTKLAWWVINFDTEKKAWFEEWHPLAPAVMTGQLNAAGQDLRVAVSDEATRVAPNIDVNVYNVYFEVVPAANVTHTMTLASGEGKKVAKNWGLTVGTTAKAALPGG